MQNMSTGKTALGLDLNIGALLCYLNICLPFGTIYSIIVLVTDKENKLPRFHAVQSLLLIPLGFVLGIIYAIGGLVGALVDSVIRFPLFTSIIALVISLIGLALLIGIIFSAIKAFQGQIFKLPVIGNFADKFSS